jgi:hypothetical protein
MMKFLERFFGSGKKKKTDTSPMPTRQLNLAFSMTAEYGSSFAKQFAGVVKKNEQLELNYSPATLDFVDEFLQRFSDEGISVNDFAETIFVAGAYVGEVMVKNNGGVWINQQEVQLPPGVSVMPIIIRLPNGTVVDPITKAFKRFHFGSVDSVRYFYDVFTKK